MNTRSIPKGRLVATAMILALLMAAAYGFAAANTVDASAAGSGSKTISGYKIDNIEYQMAAQSNTLSGVTFKTTALNGGPHADNVKAKTYDGGSYVTCSGGESDGTWTCPVTDSVELATNLTVVATGALDAVPAT